MKVTRADRRAPIHLPTVISHAVLLGGCALAIGVGWAVGGVLFAVISRLFGWGVDIPDLPP